MSEFVNNDVTESTPTTTTEAAEAVIDAFESQETNGVEVSGDTPEATETAEPAEAPAPAPVPEKELSEVEKLLHEEGFKEARREDGRENRIPYSKVKRIIENGLKKGRAEFDTRYSTIETEAKTLREQVQQLSALGEMMERDPDAFLNLVAQHDERYKRYLTPQEAAQQAAQADAEMPQPDVTLADGSRTYSLEGIQKLLDWKEQRVIQQAEKRISEKLKPYEEMTKAEKARIQSEQALQQVRTRTQEQIAEAQTWPGFKDHEAAILKALQDDSAKAKSEGRRPTLSLEGAYRQVVVARLTEDDNAKRARILKELQSAPKSTSVPRTTNESPRPTGGSSTAEVAARTLARLERGGQ
jgi:hypothetical protein